MIAPPTAFLAKLSRREFLRLSGVAGSGLLLACNTTYALGASDSSRIKFDAIAPHHRLNIFVSIHTDGTIDIVSHRSEMGQGAKTGIAQIIADELEADWEMVRVIQGRGNKAYGNQNTDGSTSIRLFWDKLREVGASARTMLESAGAEYWQVSLQDVFAKNGRVFNKKNDKSLAYGDLAELASKQSIPEPNTLKFKPFSNYQYIGKGITIVDIDDITSGKACFGIDVTLPGMLIASIERCPVLHGQVESFDRAAALAVPGVQEVIQMPATKETVVYFPLAGVAVIATNTWAAMQGRKLLNVKWTYNEEGEANREVNSEPSFDMWRKSLSDLPEKVGGKGDVTKGFELSDLILEASYQTPYLAHAPMETPAATAWFKDNKCEIYASVQDPQSTMQNAAALTGLPESSFIVTPTLLGGAFGRKSKSDFVNEAVFLSQRISKPIKVVWTREDDIKHGYYHAGAVEKIKVGIDKKGKLLAWHRLTAYPTILSTFDHKANTPQDFELSLGFADFPYDVDNALFEKAMADSPVRIGWMRSVCNIQHAFALNCAVDEAAHKVGLSMSDFILANLAKDKDIDHKEEYNFEFTNYSETLTRHPFSTRRYRKVVETLLSNAPLNEALPNGQGWGLAVHRSFVSYVAVATKVKVVEKKLAVEEMHCVIDCGTVVNPDRVRAQMEGAMIFGLSLSLMGTIDIDNGAVRQSNFHDYPVLRMSQCPAIHVHIMDGGSNAPGGVGEPGVPPVAPSVANAIFSATGNRHRTLPLNKFYSV
ncbi:molybdopterin cofactor-binding domain-containing protein [Alteromonas macleodii]|uniref:xanthine dehydrogenase family protein molybdopterin-binding subunit n=1 Tax=Alteromonas macleodii TaxID=28108 RepID=UPI002076BD30|nr:molybdopterin cofactor-binding domain-containing protein [Alteromonas macleodii]USI26434.1 molybdopterin-dependent oxidoreductase [Alteromonas macleodii]